MIKLTRETLLDKLLTTLTDEKQLNLFPIGLQEQYRKLGETALSNPNSNIRIFLEVLAASLYDQTAAEEQLVELMKPPVTFCTDCNCGKAEGCGS